MSLKEYDIIARFIDGRIASIDEQIEQAMRESDFDEARRLLDERHFALEYKIRALQKTAA